MTVRAVRSILTIVDELTSAALSVGVAAAVAAVRVAAVLEVGRQADALLGEPPVPGSLEWHAEQGGDLPVRRDRAWQLLHLRIELAAGLDPLPTIVGMRRHGATWEEIARAAGTTRQSAHERWAHPVLAILDRYGTGELGGPVARDEPEATVLGTPASDTPPSDAAPR